MPTVTVQMLAGRTVEQKKALVEKVTSAVVESVGVPAESVTVYIQEIANENFGKAGKHGK